MPPGRAKRKMESAKLCRACDKNEDLPGPLAQNGSQRCLRENFI